MWQTCDAPGPEDPVTTVSREHSRPTSTLLPMDPCEQLRYDVRDALAERDRELDQARRRFWLGLFGLEFVLEWEESSAVDRALGGFLLLVKTGEIVLAVDQLFRLLQALARITGRHGAARALGGIAGRFVGLAAMGLLVMDIAAAYDRWTRRQEINRAAVCRASSGPAGSGPGWVWGCGARLSRGGCRSGW